MTSDRIVSVVALTLAAVACVRADSDVPAPSRPSVDAVARAYVNAGWMKLTVDGRTLVCISQEGSDYVDRLFGYLAGEAKKLIGS